MANAWSDAEVEAAVADYFAMLRLELAGEKYNKTAHRHALMARLSNRSNGSVELKHQNISAVLIEMGIPYINGYKPRSNYQRTLLPAAVQRYLSSNPDLLETIDFDTSVVPAVPSVDHILAALENPPDSARNRAPSVAEPRVAYNPGGRNYLEREARNQLLGEAGEQFVINYERARLIHAGKDSLSDRIEQVSSTLGPSAGYDIRSFEVNGTDRYIEAKTTKYGKNTPFYVTPNELGFSQSNAARYYLYRVFRFRDLPRLFTLHGSIDQRCMLKPSEFLAVAR